MALEPGVYLGPYRIDAFLGAGGMGEVYRATDTRLRRAVAVKIITAEFSKDPGRLLRFQQEALAAAALNHPNILAIYDIGKDDEQTYLVSELLEGLTLRERLTSGGFNVRKSLSYAIQIAEGLGAAHEKGIVHRDVKPENLLITNDDRVKILDFGLAKLRPTLDPATGHSAVETASTITLAGVIVGTVGYMSPEQIRGEPIDGRSDLFSLGAVLYEMLAGRRAFEAHSAVETMSAILSHEPPQLGDTSTGVPTALERIVARCLEKRPSQRFRSAHDLAFALGAIGGRSEVQLSRARARVGSRRLLAVVLSVMLLSLPVFAFLAGRRTAERPLPTFQRLTFRRGAPLSARFAPDGRTIVYSAAWDGDPMRTFSTRIERAESQRLDLPDAEIEAVSLSGELLMTLGRTQGDFYTLGSWTLARVPLGGGAPRSIAEHVVGADWGPDGSIALIRHDGNRFRLEYPIGHVLYGSERKIASPRLSPDGKQVAFLAFTPSLEVMVVDRSGTARVLSTGWRYGGKHVLWSPAGDEVWFSASEGGWVWPLRAVSLKGRQRILLRLPAALIPQDLSSDGRLLLFVGSIRTAAKCLSAGEPRERDMSWFESSQIFDLSADGTTALIGEVGGPSPGREPGLYIRKTDGSQPVLLANNAYPVALAPNGEWVLMQSIATKAFGLLPTGPGQPLMLDIKGFDAVGWFPDSRRLLLERNAPQASARCYSLNIGQDKKPEALTPEGVGCGVGLSPSGGEILALNAERRWVTFSIATGATHVVPGLTATDEPLEWGPDGHSLFVQRTGLPFAQIDQLVLQTGARRLWREIAVSDPAGIVRVQSGVIMAPNGSYCYDYMQNVGELDLVRGVR